MGVGNGPETPRAAGPRSLTRTGSLPGALLISLVGALSLFGCEGGDDAHRGLIEYRSLIIEGERRDFVLHVPKGVEPSGAGLILALHYYGGTGIGFQRSSDLDRIARELGAVIAYPDAASSYWAEDCGCVPADRTHLVADTAFVSAILDSLTAEFGLDPGRHTAVGFSQGGFFSHRLGCQMAHRFRTVVAVGATMAGPLAEACEPSQPVSVLTVISRMDQAVPWEGYEAGEHTILGARETAAFWAAEDGCDGEPFQEDEDGVLRVRYTGCAGGTRVELVAPGDGEHVWSVSPSISIRREIVDFVGG